MGNIDWEMDNIGWEMDNIGWEMDNIDRLVNKLTVCPGHQKSSYSTGKTWQAIWSPEADFRAEKSGETDVAA